MADSTLPAGSADRNLLLGVLALQLDFIGKPDLQRALAIWSANRATPLGQVLVDYLGDALMAMWGAPEEQPDHPRLACRAALAMLDQVPGLNGRWQAALGEPMGLGIGINTGTAQVGNVGSRHKFKYGALGHTVNLASRVTGAARPGSILVSEETREAIGDDERFTWSFAGARHLKGIKSDVKLFRARRPTADND